MSQIAERLKEVTLESQQVDRLVDGASSLYAEKETAVERPMMVGLACIHVKSILSLLPSQITFLAQSEKS